jgi:hypothetical protein
LHRFDRGAEAHLDSGFTHAFEQDACEIGTAQIDILAAERIADALDRDRDAGMAVRIDKLQRIARSSSTRPMRSATSQPVPKKSIM